MFVATAGRTTPWETDRSAAPSTLGPFTSVCMHSRRKGVSPMLVSVVFPGHPQAYDVSIQCACAIAMRGGHRALCQPL
jgi:hypothetical protein